MEQRRLLIIIIIIIIITITIIVGCSGVSGAGHRASVTGG